MSSHAVNVECYGNLQRVPLESSFIKIDRLKRIVSARFNIDYPFNLTYDGAELCNDDSIHDLNLNSAHPVRVRRCSIDSYTADSKMDIFLSYERTHREVIRILKQKLEEKNYFCWFDVDEIPGNDQFCPAIEQGIRNSTVFVCCITSRYAESTKCRQELSFAKQLNKPIILLIMEQLTWPPHQIQTLVSGLSYIEFYNTTSSGNSTPWPPEKLNELLSKLAELAPQV